ncbi:hypothetical protein MGSAQ_001329 [marine sediment metagenome]|uniref:Uncharacterized protein n=1 Tax=marine sediment metagenome TaxID=412755 RepID=A0A1B6NUN6_9ZZZZ
MSESVFDRCSNLVTALIRAFCCVFSLVMSSAVPKISDCISRSSNIKLPRS